LKVKKAIIIINICCLEFCEDKVALLGSPDLPPAPFVTKDGTTRYEVERISNARTHKDQEDLWVEWEGHNQLQNRWLHQDVLMANMQNLVLTFDTRPCTFKA